MRAPSPPKKDEGRRRRPDAPTDEGRPARRGSGRSTYAHAAICNTGDLSGCHRGNASAGSGPDRSRRGPYDRRTRVIPGEERGPGSGCARNELRRGDWREPGNSGKDSEAPTSALREGQAGANAALSLSV